MFPFEADLRFQIEESPFSEAFDVRWGGAAAELITLEGELIGTLGGENLGTIGPQGEEAGLVLKGIFDESVEHSESTKSPRVKPRIVVYRWLRRTPPGTRVTVRGKAYKVTSHERDANHGFIVWLS